MKEDDLVNRPASEIAVLKAHESGKLSRELEPGGSLLGLKMSLVAESYVTFDLNDVGKGFKRYKKNKGSVYTLTGYRSTKRNPVIFTFESLGTELSKSSKKGGVFKIEKAEFTLKDMDQLIGFDTMVGMLISEEVMKKPLVEVDRGNSWGMW